MYTCHYIHIILVFHSGFRRQSTIRKVWLGRFILGGGESFPAVSCDVKYCHSNVFQSKGINLQLQDVSNILLWLNFKLHTIITNKSPYTLPKFHMEPENHKENAGTLGMVPYLFHPPRSPLKVDIPNKYGLYKVYMGLIIGGTIPRVPAFFLWENVTKFWTWKSSKIWVSMLNLGDF